MKKRTRNLKIVGLITIILLLNIISISGVKINNNFEKQSEFKDNELCIWRPYTCCFIIGQHFGEVAPEGVTGPSKIIDIGYGSHNIFIIGIKGIRRVNELKGFGFFGVIEYYSIPRIPAAIFGFVLFCFFK